MFTASVLCSPPVCCVNCQCAASYVHHQCVLFTASVFCSLPVCYVHRQRVVFTASVLCSLPVCCVHRQRVVFTASVLCSLPVCCVHCQCVVLQLHENEFNLNAALLKLYDYAVQYNDEVRTESASSHNNSC